MQHREIEQVNLAYYLPKEIWLYLFLYLSPEQLLLIALVNTSFRDMSRSDYIWEAKSSIHFLSPNNRLGQPNGSWYQSFQENYNNAYANTQGNLIAFTLKKTFFPNSFEAHIKKIFSLVKEGDLDGLQTYKMQPHDLDIQDADGVTLLEWANRCNKQQILDHFFTEIKHYFSDLSEQYFSKKTDEEGRTLLHWSILCNQPKQIVLALICEGYDVNAATTAGLKAIHLACAKGRIAIIDMLLELYPELLDQRDVFDKSPLFHAIVGDHAEVVDLLINNHADLTILTDDVRRLIHFVCCDGHFNYVKRILTEQPHLLNQTDSLGQTPILWAASRGRANIVEFLINLGANLDQATNSPLIIQHGFTALHWSLEGGHIETAKLLINHNALLNIMGNGLHVIHQACMNGHFEIVQLLLQKQMSLLNLTDNVGQTPILWAAAHGHTDIVGLLANLGADLNQVTNTPDRFCHGYTALHWAAIGQYRETVKVLLKYKASSWILSLDNELAADVTGDIFIKELIHLDNLIHRLENNSFENTMAYRFFHFFKENKLIDESAVLDAAQVLMAVMLGNAKSSLLSRYEKELSEGELGSIYKTLATHLSEDLTDKISYMQN